MSKNYVLMIKEVRKSKGLTQHDMAVRMNIKQQTYQSIESDKNTPGIDKLVEISKILECSIDDLVKPS